MKWTLEVIAVPVSDVARAKEFYSEGLGFVVDHDVEPGGGARLVQLTPPGSGCSIVLGEGITDMPPGSLRGVQLVVADLRAARAELVERGVEVSEIQLLGDPAGPRPPKEGESLDNVGFVSFADPDGNTWGVQQISARADS
ncbi:VOC family protein [Actinoalloteichus hymeniacidonis]|uniref:Lactoylglutathione lyase-like lyase n=1 Tax=Actinoalloteichus hymeniacidonis TaxID=340345 RepID=A0AAC9HQT8_9PSEU|nr:VOC family protein [Actinoalloteichus hymeniacidonis]AOS63829.1 lactoylglutathione lyase-like lyase [Actinoalloteichus hymeniacidonis]MBB5908116.1 catechol 2,3-dioxygenase-like lactoylglutathione lyase family enzyme [Actinoalloteichus hymeniacidonis]